MWVQIKLRCEALMGDSIQKIEELLGLVKLHAYVCSYGNTCYSCGKPYIDDVHDKTAQSVYPEDLL